ncbi:MAG: molybdenum cofactor biosynthesis protein MoaE [Anaerolineaceae bacterium]|jgi:molybdopterin synthase catalytic subunit
MVNFSIIFFATLKDKIGAGKLDVQFPSEPTVSELRVYLVQQYPAVKPFLVHSIASVNRQYAFDDDRIPQDAEVALFPPVSGGTELPTIIKVSVEPLDLNGLLAEMVQDTTGAACIFTGVVRGLTQRGEFHLTTSLVYEAYIPMAEEKMEQVAEEIRMRWPDIEGIGIIQRIGHLDTGTPTVAIACTSSHRDCGIFEAARYGIDRLKEIVPVWKREIGPQGEMWIEGKYQPKRGD